MLSRPGRRATAILGGLLLIAAGLGVVAHLVLRRPSAPAAEVILGGDVMLDRGVRKYAEVAGDPAYPFGAITPLLRPAHVAFANLECPLTRRQVPALKRFVFRCDPAAADLLHAAGFTALTLANNHSIDQGRDGLVDSLERLRQVGVVPVGAGRDRDQAAAPVFVEAGGFKLALLGFVDMPLENVLSSIHDRPGPAFADPDRVRAALAAARRQADFVIVSVHWGTEFQGRPSPRQRRLARLMIESGADLIVGHHPHVLQTIEMIGRVPVCYSLGNLIFDQDRDDRKQTVLLRARFQKNRPLELAVLPLVIERGRPAPAGPEAARAIIDRLGRLSPGVDFAPRDDGWSALEAAAGE